MSSLSHILSASSIHAADKFHALFGEHLPSPIYSPPQALEGQMHEPLQWVLFREMYLSRLELRHPGSEHVQHAKAVLDRFTQRRNLVGKTLQEITQLDLEQYAASRSRDTWRGKPIGPRTINNEIDILNAAFAYAGPSESRGPAKYYLNILQKPPGLDRLPLHDLEPVLLTDERLAKLFGATRFARTPRLEGCSPQSFWMCALVLDTITLLRRSALLKIPRPSDYDLLELKRLKLPAAINKRRSDEWVSLGSREILAELFAALPSKPGEPLLPWRKVCGEGMTVDHFTFTMREFQRAAGLSEAERVTLKHLRSTSATKVGDQFSDSVAKRKLKHSPTSQAFEKHYKSRAPTAPEIHATDFLADAVMDVLKKSITPDNPTLSVVG